MIHARAMNCYAQTFFLAHFVGSQWLLLRLAVCFSAVYTAVALMGVTSPQAFDEGSLGLALLFCVLVLQSLDASVEPFLGTQAELVVVDRLLSCFVGPSEAAAVLPDDPEAKSFTVKLCLASNGSGSLLTIAGGGPGCDDMNGMTVPLHVVDTNGQVLFEASEEGEVLVATSLVSDSCLFSAAGQETEALCGLEQGGHVIAVNGVTGSATCMARELVEAVAAKAVNDGGSDREVWLRIRGGWLKEGARLEVNSLCISYPASNGRDAVHGLSVNIKPRCTVGILGPAGSGKSALFLAMLRILEPRQGRIRLNGVDTAGLGLHLLRSVVGLVPQEPLLFQGTLRFNLDPQNEHAEASILKKLRGLGLERLLEDTKCLTREVTGDGRDLSTGERQLLSLARMVLRQPPVLLIDSCLSALDLRSQDAALGAAFSDLTRSTVLVASRRPEVLTRCSQVIVLE